MSPVLYLIVGLVLGAAAAWLIFKARLEGRAASSDVLVGELRKQASEKDSALVRIREELDSERSMKVRAETELKSSEDALREQKALIETMKKELTDTFGALSAAALKSSSEDFLRLANEYLGKALSETKGRLGEHQTAMDGLVAPLRESLQTYEKHLGEIEVKRGQAYASLDEQIKMLAETHHRLQKETGSLVAALRKPHVRGRWGEVTLRNAVELAGMSAHCDFSEQVTVDAESGRLRPDMVVRLPGGRDIVVDSKVSMEALLDAAHAQTEEEKRDALKRHSQHVREQINRLSSKAYWSQFPKSPELAVLFVGEAALVSALESEPTLMEDSMSRRVLIATPTTLFALLSAVSYGWRQEQVAKNAERIGDLGKELFERVKVWTEHMNDISVSLGKAVEAFNKATGSFDLRILPSVRKFKELGAAQGEVPELKQIEKKPRSLNLAD